MDVFEIQSFSEVWDRVEACPGCAPSPAPAAVSPAPVSGCGDELRGFIASETAAARYYAAMSARWPCGGTFRRLSSGEAGHARRLRAACFVRTGDGAAQCALPPRLLSLSDALKTVYAAETAAAAAYSAAARDADDEKLAALYTELAADETRHARVIGGLIERMLR